MSAIDIKTHLQDRSVWTAFKRGALCRCPACGEGKLFTSYLKVAQTCDACGTELHHHRADDAPPYVVIFIVGHALVAALLVVEDYLPDLSLWAHAVLWTALALLACLWLLPVTKGALVGYQWALRMHGFGDEPKGASRATQGMINDGGRNAGQTAAG